LSGILRTTIFQSGLTMPDVTVMSFRKDPYLRRPAPASALKCHVLIGHRAFLVFAIQSFQIDAKFYAEPFLPSYGALKIRAAHLYQLYAYMKNSQGSAGVTVDGALVYASSAESMSRHYEIDGHTIVVLTVDLSRRWPEIHRALLSLLSDFDIRDFDPTTTPTDSADNIWMVK
jgi:hypothetical protein